MSSSFDTFPVVKYPDVSVTNATSTTSVTATDGIIRFKKGNGGGRSVFVSFSSVFGLVIVSFFI
jgi:hypothetical protein